MRRGKRNHDTPDIDDNELDSSPTMIRRSEVESRLREAVESGNPLDVETARFVRAYPDIAQLDADALSRLPGNFLSSIRRFHGISGYVFCSQLADTPPSKGLYHVQMVGGERLLISRVQFCRGRTIHDPVSIEPNEFETVKSVFGRVREFLNDPVQWFAKAQTAPENTPKPRRRAGP